MERQPGLGRTGREGGRPPVQRNLMGQQHEVGKASWTEGRDGIEAEVHSEFLREAALSQKATGLDLKGRKFPVPLVPGSVLLR